MADITRRRAMGYISGVAGGALLPRLAWADEKPVALELGPAQEFSYEALVARAKALAASPYVAAPTPAAPEVLDAINYEALGKVSFKPECALWSPGSSENPNGSKHYPATFFHMGRFFRRPQRFHLVEGGRAREIVYRRDYFNIPPGNPAAALPEGSGFAGFRFQEDLAGSKGWRGVDLDWRKNDWVAFLGASYYRAIGDEFQYGASARGVLIDAATTKAEEFPDYTHIFLEQPDAKGPGGPVFVYALLDGPSITGAYRFEMHRNRDVVMDVDCTLFMRQDVLRLGIAPLTSMYWFSETNKPTAIDWRPEVHDSDGLSLATGHGERIWRPLNNPPRVNVSVFRDDNPRGFGLAQRDHDVDHYGDGVNYHRRPTVWIETKGNWGKGSVQLIEIPTDDEIHDNIVAAWVPDRPAEKGATFTQSYRVLWQAQDPPQAAARVVATRLGNGGQAGTVRPKGVRKFVAEFLGEPLTKLPSGVFPEAVVTASRGTISHVYTEALPNDVPGHWRAVFDLAVEGSEPVELRCFLRLKDETLSETWSYQYHPF